jgi:hypothetical protein
MQIIRCFAAAVVAFILAAALPAQPPAAAPAAAAAAAPVPERIPAEALADLPFIRMPTLSPDGNRLAAHLTAQGKDWIGVFDLRRPFEEQQPVMIEWGDYDVIWLRWVGNERILFGLQLLRPLPLFDIEVPVTRAGVIDLRTGATTPLIGGQGIMGDDIIFVDPNGQYVLLSSQESLDDYPSVDRFDLATGRSTRVQSSLEGVWNWFADGAGVAAPASPMTRSGCASITARRPARISGGSTSRARRAPAA